MTAAAAAAVAVVVAVVVVAVAVVVAAVEELRAAGSISIRAQQPTQSARAACEDPSPAMLRL